MGSWYKNGRIRSYIIIILAIVALFVSAPIKKAISLSVNNRVSDFINQLHEKTGLSISYDKLSPSILSNFYIRNICVFDDSGNQLLTINKTRITYSIFSILRKNMQKGISSVVVDGIKLDVDELAKIMQAFGTNENSNQGIAEIKKMIPANVKLKNIYLEYDDNNVNAILNIKSLNVSNPLKRKAVNIQGDALVNATVYAINKKISGKASVSGSITDNFDGSQLNLKLRDFTDGDFRLNKLNLHASYNQDTFEAHTIQAVNPVSLGIFYDVKSGELNANLQTQKLKPLALLSVNSKLEDLKKYQNLIVDTDTVVKCNLNEKTFDFSSDTQFEIPNEVFSGGLLVGFELSGNEKKADLSRFFVNGERCTASATLSYIYDSMQLSGVIELPQFILENGNTISTEVYIDSQKKGFMAFSPQVFVGNRALTALQLNFNPQDDETYDFDFELSDYSHTEQSEPGMLKVDGSFLKVSNYFQTNITLTSLYLDSIAALAAQFLPSQQAGAIEAMQPNLAQFVFSSDVYLSTDLKTVSYNIPVVILANTKSDNQLIKFALNGSEKNIQLNEFSLVAGSYTLDAFASVEQAPDSSDMFFTADINAASIPYHFSGTIMPEVCTIFGDYGMDFEVRKQKNNSLLGHISMKSLPLKVLDSSWIFSTSSDFSYDFINGPSIKISQLEIEEAGSASQNPKLVLSGNATKYGAQFDSISYADLYSDLEGSADLMININEGIFDSVGVMVNLRNPMSAESLIIDGNVSNPEHLPLTKDNLLQKVYMNLQLKFNTFSLNRFMTQKSLKNYITGTVFTSGTLEHPYAAISVDKLSLLIAADTLTGSGNIVLEDRDLTISDLGFAFEADDIRFSNIQAKGSLTDFTLDATGQFDFSEMGKTLHAPLYLTIGNAVVPEGKLFPDSISAKLSTPQFSGTLLKKNFPLSFSVFYENKIFSISSSNNCGLHGNYYLESGLLELDLNNKNFLSAKMDGLIDFNQMNLTIYDIKADLPKMWTYLDLDEFLIVEKGLLTGEIGLTGSVDEPELNGSALIASPVAKVPLLTKQKLTTPNIYFNIVNNEIQIPETIVAAKNNQRLVMDFTIFMNKWDFDHMDGHIKTYVNPKTKESDQFLVNFKTPEVSLDGNIIADLTEIHLENDILTVRGKISGENIDLGAQLFAIANMTSGAVETMESDMQVIADLTINLGTHASVRLDPLLRCVFVPNTSMHIEVNQPDGYYSVDGELNLKTGDIAYLNRSFYIKSGSIKFNKEDITNPLITINAETREKDALGQTVKIILSVEEQHLLDFQPKISSIPPKSENELRTLLGDIVMADSNSIGEISFVLADYALQSTFLRQTENKLRNLINFDIFSLRTNLAQNVYNMSSSGNFKENFTIGNFLDNTTVYIGKYIGSSLYVDGMVHFSFENGNTADFEAATKNMYVQPEIGLELESPFVNVRVNMAPDINALLKNQFVPSTSVTLSWKFTF